jgi:hypothetical protein
MFSKRKSKEQSLYVEGDGVKTCANAVLLLGLGNSQR